MAKGKVLQMPERGIQVTMNGVNIGAKVSARDCEVICRWLQKSHRTLAAYYRRAMLKSLPGWGCVCSCHRLRQATRHCVGCDDGSKLGKLNVTD